MVSYLVTIKNNSMKYTSPKEIYNVYNTIVKKGGEWHSDKMLELDKHQRLHLHTVLIKDNIYFKRYKQKGWTIHFQKIKDNDLFKIIAYIYKQGKNKYDIEQMDHVSYYAFNYGFRF